MNLVDWLFNKVIRLYVKSFLVLAIFAFILTTIVEVQLMSSVVFVWSTIHLFLLLFAFYFHVRLKLLVEDDLNKLVLIIASNTVNKIEDTMSLISLQILDIPKEIKTVNTNARVVLAALKEIPFVNCIVRTIHNNLSYYQYDWLKIDKLEFDKSFDSLIIGDIIFYHNKRSIIGKCIRFFTRCHWEHTATYLGNGHVVEMVPTGGIESDISGWFSNNDIELAILRFNTDRVPQPKLIETIKSGVGTKYNYMGAFSQFWVIITGKLCDGLMTPLIFFTNLLLLGIVYLNYFNAPELPRIGLLFLVISSVYMFDCIYHWLAYSPNLNLLFESINEKSRN